MRAARLASASAALLMASLASAQVTPPPLPFTIKVQQGTSIVNATDGSLIAFQADAIGVTASAGVSVTHLGVTPPTPNAAPVGTVSITAVDLTGSTDFSVTGVPDPSQGFAPNQLFTLTVRYKPSTSLRVQGLLKISYSEQLPTPTNGVMPKPTLGSFSLNLSGVAPEFTFSYQPPPGNNTTPLLPNGTIQFPVTNVNDTPLATVIINNIGSGPGVVSAVTVTGAADFAAVNLPAPGASVDTLKSVSFGVRYSPLLVETATGSISSITRSRSACWLRVWVRCLRTMCLDLPGRPRSCRARRSSCLTRRFPRRRRARWWFVSATLEMRTAISPPLMSRAQGSR
jgi:hypothetical protein